MLACRLHRPVLAAATAAPRRAAAHAERVARSLNLRAPCVGTVPSAAPFSTTACAAHPLRVRPQSSPLIGFAARTEAAKNGGAALVLARGYSFKKGVSPTSLAVCGYLPRSLRGHVVTPISPFSVDSPAPLSRFRSRFQTFLETLCILLPFLCDCFTPPKPAEYLFYLLRMRTDSILPTTFASGPRSEAISAPEATERRGAAGRHAHRPGWKKLRCVNRGALQFVSVHLCLCLL